MRTRRIAGTCAGQAHQNGECMRKLTRSLGWVLLALSVAAVVQSTREFLLWSEGARTFDEIPLLGQPLTFGGHRIAIEDDQPLDPVPSQEGFEGRLWMTIDGVPVGSPSRAMVRRGLSGLGRYHLWLDAGQFQERE